MEHPNELSAAVKMLEEHFRRHGRGKSMDYVYGYMDALARVREMAERDMPGKYSGGLCDTL